MMTRTILASFIILLTVGLSLPSLSLAQHVLPPDQPEQDACNALVLCGGTFATPYSYQGQGHVNDLNTTPCGPGEDNSMWIKVTIATAGTLAFKIIPVDAEDDYDFAVVKLNGECNKLTSGDVVRCDLNNDMPGSTPDGVTGLSDTAKQTEVQDGTFGYPFVSSIQAQPGETYLIMINNFGHDNDPGPSNGFTIDFESSTATFAPHPPPAIVSIEKQCITTSLTVTLSFPIMCSSIASDGSNFNISPAAVPITSAAGVNCVGSSGYTSQVTLGFASPLPAGSYTLNVQSRTNGGPLLGLCGGSDSVGPTTATTALSFTAPPPVQDNYLPPDTTKCNYSTVSIAALRAFDSYQWSSGQITPSISVLDPGTYTLVVSDSNGCIGRDSTTIIDSVCPQYVYLPSAFTPNGDGKNDIFRPIFAGPTAGFRFAVFDRWGREVFKSSNPSEGWDGTTGGRQQPAGTYVWMCIYQLFQEPQRVQRGTVILIR